MRMASRPFPAGGGAGAPRRGRDGKYVARSAKRRGGAGGSFDGGRRLYLGLLLAFAVTALAFAISARRMFRVTNSSPLASATGERHHGRARGDVPSRARIRIPVPVPGARAGAEGGNVGVPSDLVVHGKRSDYAQVPETHRRRFYIPPKHKGYSDVVRAFRNRNWTLAERIEDAHFFYRSKGLKTVNYYDKLKPWQRYGRVPGISALDDKDGFVEGFFRYRERNPHAKSSSLYFLPKTFLLKDAAQRRAFQNELDHRGGRGKPWVLKKAKLNNGAGIEVMGPNSEALDTAVDRAAADEENSYIVQEYICNELTWYDGEKFDLRMFWLVASVDPIIVLYHDGYVRVGTSYNETDFSDAGKHLTNHAYRTADESRTTKEDLWTVVRNHHGANRNSFPHIDDPVRHVRNQIKEAMGATVSAFRDVTFGNAKKKVTAENLFGFYGCDFVIDNDLDVYYTESQASPGFGKPYDYRVDMYRQIFRSMIDVVEEISLKQESDPRANLLPLEKLGGWEIVYAGDWQFAYEGYTRSNDKKGCSVGAA